MNKIGKLIESLYSDDNMTAYKGLKLLETESEQSNIVYEFFDQFVKMMEDDNSFIRTRGLILISANAKWDTDNRIDEIIDSYLNHISDKKPITSRQCIKALPNIAKYKKDLVPRIRERLLKADTQRYKDSMQPLVYKDMVSVLKEIEG